MMDFYAVFDQVVALLQRRSRVTYNALKLQFHLDDASGADAVGRPAFVLSTWCWSVVARRLLRRCRICSAPGQAWVCRFVSVASNGASDGHVRE